MKISKRNLKLIFERYLLEGEIESFDASSTDISKEKEILNVSHSDVDHTGGSIVAFDLKKLDGDDKPVRIKIKTGVKINKTTEETQNLIRAIYKLAKEKNIPDPVITSGFRSSKDQAEAMFNNWNKYGGKTGGTQYLIDLYANDNFAKEVGSSFESTGSFEGAIKIIDKYPGAHYKGLAFDLRLTPRIDDIMNDEKIKALCSKKTAKEKDHWHVVVKS